MVVSRYLQRFAPLLALCNLAFAEDEPATPTVTEAPVYLPYWHPDAWSLVRGSIIASNPEAEETTYTIFCPEQTPPACDLALEFPFVIVGGPHKVQFHGTYTSTYIANVECELEGTTAATCSGYSSLTAGYTNGLFTGPTEVSWTSTFTGYDAEWGTLTMGDKPTDTADLLDLAETNPPSPTADGDSVQLNAASSTARTRFDRQMATGLTLGSLLVARYWF